jgi:hypothetical protein
MLAPSYGARRSSEQRTHFTTRYVGRMDRKVWWRPWNRGQGDDVKREAPPRELQALQYEVWGRTHDGGLQPQDDENSEDRIERDGRGVEALNEE